RTPRPRKDSMVLSPGWLSVSVRQVHLLSQQVAPAERQNPAGLACASFSLDGRRIPGNVETGSRSDRILPTTIPPTLFGGRAPCSIYFAAATPTAPAFPAAVFSASAAWRPLG